MILSQILSAVLKRNVWRSVLRICVWMLGLKGLIVGYVILTSLHCRHNITPATTSVKQCRDPGSRPPMDSTEVCLPEVQ